MTSVPANDDRQAKIAEIIEQTRSSLALSSNAKSVLHALLGLDGERGAQAGMAYATTKEIAKLSGVSYITATRMLQRLDDLGAFKRCDRIYPKQILPCGRRSIDGCTVYTFDYEGMLALSATPVLTKREFRTSNAPPVTELVLELCAQVKGLREEVAQLRKTVQPREADDTAAPITTEKPVSGIEVTSRLMSGSSGVLRYAA